MDSNGNLNYAERLALRPGDRVVYQTEALAHRGEMAGTVTRVCQDGGVWIGKHGARYALLSDFVRRADWPGEAQQPAEATPDAPEGQETASGVYGPVLVPDPETGLPVNPGVAEVRELRERVAALTADRDIVYCKIAKLQCVLREIVSVLAGDVQ